MKLNIMLAPDDPARKELEALGIEHDPQSEYSVMMRNGSLNYLQVKNGESSFYLNIHDIIFIESMGHDILVHTADGTYQAAERLKQLELLLDPQAFLRVSNSAIIAIGQIKKIEVSLLQKFVLHMTDGSRVDVTRSYYYIFKDRLGI